MKRRDTHASRFALVTLALVLAAAALYFSGWATIAKNVAVLAWRGNTMVNLAKRTPFTALPGAGVSEERLESFLTVRGRIKPFGDRIDAWEAERSTGGSKSRFNFKGRAAGLVEAYLNEFSSALEQERMGPAEYSWIEGRMRQASVTGASDPGSESDRALFAKHRDRLSRSALGPHASSIAEGFAR